MTAQPSRHSAEPLTVHEALLVRIRGEYREMPGLRLTFTQATRLWQVDPVLCRMALTTLLEQGVLRLTPDSAFVLVDSGNHAQCRPLTVPTGRDQQTREAR